jgi:hypothetical protein
VADRTSSASPREIEFRAGEWIGEACARLVEAAPAFMTFNGVRIESKAGTSAADIEAQWRAEMDRQRAEYEASPEYARAQKEAEARHAETERLRRETLSTLGPIREKYLWSDAMGEISGFGGDYEQACRDMVHAGLAWLDAHPGADLKAKTYANIYGILTPESDDAKALEKAVLSACPDCSGAMHQATMTACAYIARNGWSKYVEEMTQREARHG